MTDSAPHSDLWQEALGVLAKAHYLLAVITLLAAPLGIYLTIVGWPLLYPPRGAGWAPRPGSEILDPQLWGAALVALGVLLSCLSLMHAALLVYVGRCLARRKRRRFCLAFSIFDLTYVPLGTALSLAAIILLLRPPVREAFDRDDSLRPPSASREQD